MVISILVRLNHRSNKNVVVILKSTDPFLMVSYYWRTDGKERIQFCRFAKRSHPQVSGATSGDSKKGCFKRKIMGFIWF